MKTLDKSFICSELLQPKSNLLVNNGSVDYIALNTLSSVIEAKRSGEILNVTVNFRQVQGHDVNGSTILNVFADDISDAYVLDAISNKEFPGKKGMNSAKDYSDYVQSAVDKIFNSTQDTPWVHLENGYSAFPLQHSTFDQEKNKSKTLTTATIFVCKTDNLKAMKKTLNFMATVVAFEFAQNVSDERKAQLASFKGGIASQFYRIGRRIKQGNDYVRTTGTIVMTPQEYFKGTKKELELIDSLANLCPVNTSAFEIAPDAQIETYDWN